MADNHIHNVAIIGAAGTLGSHIVSALLATNPPFKLTSITRSSSNSASALTSSPNLTVVKGSYDDESFLTKALQGQDALILAFGLTTPPEVYSHISKAAAAAGVPFIIPSEFGSDTVRENLTSEVPILQEKVGRRAEIEQLGVSSWIGIACNPWIASTLKGGFYGIDIPNKKAVIYDSGNVKFNATTIETAALATARLLALPVKASGSEASLEGFKNKLVYVRSFHVSQNELLESVQKVTGKEGWEVERRNLDSRIQGGKDKVASGDFMGNLDLLFGTLMKEGVGDHYVGPLANDDLRLPQENLDEVVAGVVKDS